MSKKLSEMTLEELWQLFPIVLRPYNPLWTSWYDEEQAALAKALPEGSWTRISHVGSTAVPGIWAKPIVDILLEASPAAGWDGIAAALQAAGWLCMSQSPERRSFNKGYTEEGFAERVFHLHLRRPGDCPEIAFRDYLRTHSGTAREYEALKLDLWRRFEHDRDGYTAAKTEFVRKVGALAEREGGRN